MGVEFFLILQAAKPTISGGIFWRLLLGTVLMLAFGYMGEAQLVNPWMGFAVGEAGSIAGEKDAISPYVASAFGTMRFIVTVGWSIYPLGYFFGYLMNGVANAPLNLIYNLADFVNKIAFCLAIWHAAKSETREKQGLKQALLL